MMTDYSWDRVATRTPTNLQKISNADQKKLVKEKICKTCQHYDFMSCKVHADAFVGPDAECKFPESYIALARYLKLRYDAQEEASV